MKIAYILTTFPSQSEWFALREIENLQSYGLDITVFAASAYRNGGAEKTAIKSVYRPSFFSVRTISSIAYMCRRYPFGLLNLFVLILGWVFICRREAAVLVCNIHTIFYFARIIDLYRITHIHSYFLSWPACIGLALAKINPKPFSISAHSRDIFVESGAVKPKVSQARFVVSCSKQGLNYLKGNLPLKYHKRLHLNYHGISISSQFRSCDKQQSKFFNILIAVGRLVPKKGFSNLLRAFWLVLQRNPHCILLIVGQGPEYHNLNQLIDELHLRKSAHLLGFQDNETAVKLIEQAAVLVVPSIIAEDGDRDGIPNVILEAWLVKTPVIATNLPGISEIITQGQTGLLVSPADAKELACTIQVLFDDSELRTRLSENGYQTLIEDFNSAKNCSRLAALFKNAGL